MFVKMTDFFPGGVWNQYIKIGSPNWYPSFSVSVPFSHLHCLFCKDDLIDSLFHKGILLYLQQLLSSLLTRGERITEPTLIPVSFSLSSYLTAPARHVF